MKTLNKWWKDFLHIEGDYSNHLHKVVAIMICAWTGWYLSTKFVGYFDSKILAALLVLVVNMLICFIIGYSKEQYDKRVRNTFFDRTDVIATMKGGAVITIIAVVLTFLIAKP